MLFFPAFLSFPLSTDMQYLDAIEFCTATTTTTTTTTTFVMNRTLLPQMPDEIIDQPFTT
jgi:hypothetical protein